MNKTDVIPRLQAVASQIDEIIGMVDETDTNIKAIRCIQAIQAELRRISLELIEDHLTSCVMTATTKSSCKRLEALNDIQDLLCCANRFGL